MRSIQVALLRHAQTAWNRERRLVGRADPPLTPEGEAECAGWCLPADLAGLDAAGRLGWAVSPLRRARATAARLGAGAARVEPRLVERDWGEWTGLPIDAVEARLEGGGWAAAAPGGESPAEVLLRVRDWLAEVAATDGPEVWLAVAHRGLIRIVLAAAVGWDLRQPAPFRLLPARLHRIRRRGDGHLQLVTLNEPLGAA
jgi:probable phosphoglycerate mutase